MSFRQRIAFYLVHGLGYTNKEARKLMASGRLALGGRQVTENIQDVPGDDLLLDGQVIRKGHTFQYIVFYKPPGIETTYNAEIMQNLATVLPPALRLPYAGRLDKASEGLLLLSDDGRLVKSITDPVTQKEKEYTVRVDQSITDDFLEKMAAGITIQGYTTKPCRLLQSGDKEFTIILTEGKNRQIRRMCYKLGYEVLFLRRIRIDSFVLGDLAPGEWKHVSPAGMNIHP